MTNTTQPRLITVAIHTYEKASMLKSLLENEGVPVVLQNVNLVQPVVSSGVRVRIREEDLPLALRIIENTEIFTSGPDAGASKGPSILVPVDFTDYSLRAACTAFRIAADNNARITLLHSFVSPYIASNIQLSDNLTYEIAETERRHKIEAEATEKLDAFAAQLREMIKRGTIPAVKFSTELTEGVPEENISAYVREHHPWLIVMGPRAAVRREQEMIGSVSAEVLDSCRVQALTVPAPSHLESLTDLRHIVLFSTLEQEDILAFDALMRLIPDTSKVSAASMPKITIITIAGRRHSTETAKEANAALIGYYRKHYPQFQFSLKTLSMESLVGDYERIDAESPVSLAVVANRKRNIFARLFNPGIAHRILFHFDIPLFVVPV